MYKNKSSQQDNSRAAVTSTPTLLSKPLSQSKMPIAALLLALVLAATSLFSLASPAQADSNEIGEGTVFTYMEQEPGFPEGIVVHGNRVFVSTPARFGTAGTGPSQIFVYDRLDGSLVQTIIISGEVLSQEHALSGLAIDGNGRLYAISTQLGIIRFTKMGQAYVQEPWADPIPDLNPNDPIPPLPNDIVFDEAGNLYLTDSLQATIWRIPTTGGQPQIWFQDQALAITGQAQLGPNGIRLSPQRDYVYFVYSGGPALNPYELAQPGRIYRLPLVENPTAVQLETVFTYSEFDQPDGLAFEQTGQLYVVLAGTNAISILDIDAQTGQATEQQRLTGPSNSPLPYVQPANIAFDSRTHSLLVTNHAIFAPLPHNLFAVLQVFVDAEGDPLAEPDMDQD